MRVKGRLFNRKQVQWLIDREPLLATAGNSFELRWRIEHLADGTLEDSLDPTLRNPAMVYGTYGGLPSEKKLWLEFIAMLDRDKQAKNELKR
jgi:hypothetical protein